MEIRAYDRAYSELYLNNAMNTLATMFDYAVNTIHIDIDITFKRFVDSDFASRFENGDPNVIAGKSGVELYWEINKTTFNSLNNRIILVDGYELNLFSIDLEGFRQIGIHLNLLPR